MLTKADIAVTYDVSNDFFSLWLDRREMSPADALEYLRTLVASLSNAGVTEVFV